MKREMQKTVTVIIPVYNVEEYLSQCLDSVCNQTYEHLEIIIVDDGSKDSSGIIANKYQLKDGRIKVIHKENGGLSSARNVGICHATGDYYLFVDSDDYIDTNMIEILYETMMKHQAQLVECGMRKVYPNGSYIEDCNRTEVILSGKEAVSSFLEKKHNLKPVACDSLFAKELFRDIRFEEGRLHEDAWFKYKAFYKANKVVVIPKALYNYRQDRDGSIMTVNVKPKNIRDIIDAFETRYAFFDSQNEEKLMEKALEAYYRELLSYYYVVNTKLKDKESAKAFSNEITMKLKNGKGFIKKSNNLKKWRKKYWLFYYFRHLSLVSYRIIRTKRER